MVVRNSWVVQGIKDANFIDKAAFETVKRQGEQAIQNWIKRQLEGTSVTVVLIGAETLGRPYVQYEIIQSIIQGNGIIGVHINGIKDLKGDYSRQGNIYTQIGSYSNGSPIYFNAIANGIYNYQRDDGYNNIGAWIEAAARKPAGVM